MEDITEAEVHDLQAYWASKIVYISQVHAEWGPFVQECETAAGKLYGYGHFPVMFKPTKATTTPFRPDGASAMSYFIGKTAWEAYGEGNAGCEEDGGFAINGGDGWKSVVFTNHQIQLHGPIAFAMGSYVFTNLKTGQEVTVEYTFGYKRCEDGNARIFLHHSSVPYHAAH